MASDIVEFQRRKFLTSLSTLEGSKTKLPDELLNEFLEIKKLIDDDADSVRRNVWSYPAASSFLLPFLNDLNDALADCIAFAEHSPEVTVSQTFSTLSLKPSPRFSVSKMKKKLIENKDELAQKIDDLIFEFEISGTTGTRFFPSGRHTSFGSNTDSQLIGVDDEEKRIKNLILDGGFKAIGVYGIGGSGKTALLRKVLKQFSFSPVIWLCLSDIHSQEDADFEVNIIKFILCELDCDVDSWTDTNPSKADLLKQVKKLLMGKKYMIVFDDVWEKNELYSKLDGGDDPKLKANLSEALPRDKGSKIIISSRLKQVVEDMVVDQKNLISMKPMNRENCRLLLEQEIGFLGYASEIERLITNGSKFVGIGIYGPSSSAKTALVRRVLESSSSVCEKFELKRWVFLNKSDRKGGDSAEILDIGDAIVKSMLKALHVDDELSKKKNHQDFEEIVKEALGSKKYVIVLADVWHENYEEWDRVRMRLSRALPRNSESAVIVTTEDKNVAQKLVGGDNLVHVRLPELGSSERNQVSSDRQYVTDDLVDQCRGLPLAAKTLAKIINERYLPG